MIRLYGLVRIQQKRKKRVPGLIKHGIALFFPLVFNTVYSDLTGRNSFTHSDCHVFSSESDVCRLSPRPVSETTCSAGFRALQGAAEVEGAAFTAMNLKHCTGSAP